MVAVSPTDDQTTLEKLGRLLAANLDVHDQDNGDAAHRVHAFPAKFPPHLPRTFIQSLTIPGDTVLDPMMGSGTTVLEAFLLGRKAIGFDIDPLAILLAKTKTSPVHPHDAFVLGQEIVSRAEFAYSYHRNAIEAELSSFWDEKTQDFVNSWFPRDVQVALKAILNEIARVEDETLRDFFKLSFSAIIITKSGGVSLALDLAHTRPHRAAFAVDWHGNVVVDRKDVCATRKKVCSKHIRSPFAAFERKMRQNLTSFLAIGCSTGQTDMFNRFEAHMERLIPQVSFGDAQNMPLDASCVDLIVTSPPYAANAIDYMRAHKFSLVWFGYSIADLTEHRKRYIGSEGTSERLNHLPAQTMGVIERVSARDSKKGRDLHRYYSALHRVLSEVVRVLKPGGTALFVVGDSKIRGQNATIPECLSDIGESLGLVVPRIGVRQLERNRRMLPVGAPIDPTSPIQQRMHEEYVIGFYKPRATTPRATTHG